MADEPRTASVSARLSEAERSRVDAACAAAGLPRGEWVRNALLAALDGPPAPSPVAAAPVSDFALELARETYRLIAEHTAHPADPNVARAARAKADHDLSRVEARINARLAERRAQTSP